MLVNYVKIDLSMKVFIIACLTADGFIGQNADHLSTTWTSPEDTKFFIKMSKEAGVVVMGSRTFSTINRSLPGRRLIVYTPNADDIKVADVETTNEDPVALVKRLENEGAQAVAIAGGASIYAMFMASGVVDELYLTIEPVIFGQGLPLFNETLPAIKLTLIDSQALNPNTMMLHYAFNK
ncbi:MAG: dihydrofolate reductase family protein [Candidatus Saccharimonadales bacterium]|jgi:dihydrofolate reductase